MDATTITILCAVIGSVIGLAAWLATRDKKNASASEWKGVINTKLDVLIDGQNKMVNFPDRLTCVEKDVEGHEKRLTALEK